MRLVYQRRTTVRRCRVPGRPERSGWFRAGRLAGSAWPTRISVARPARSPPATGRRPASWSAAATRAAVAGQDPTGDDGVPDDRGARPVGGGTTVTTSRSGGGNWRAHMESFGFGRAARRWPVGRWWSANPLVTASRQRFALGPVCGECRKSRPPRVAGFRCPFSKPAGPGPIKPRHVNFRGRAVTCLSSGVPRWPGTIYPGPDGRKPLFDHTLGLPLDRHAHPRLHRAALLRTIDQAPSPLRHLLHAPPAPSPSRTRSPSHQPRHPSPRAAPLPTYNALPRNSSRASERSRRPEPHLSMTAPPPIDATVVPIRFDDLNHHTRPGQHPSRSCIQPVHSIEYKHLYTMEVTR